MNKSKDLFWHSFYSTLNENLKKGKKKNIKMGTETIDGIIVYTINLKESSNDWAGMVWRPRWIVFRSCFLIWAQESPLAILRGSYVGVRDSNQGHGCRRPYFL